MNSRRKINWPSDWALKRGADAIVASGVFLASKNSKPIGQWKRRLAITFAAAAILLATDNYLFADEATDLFTKECAGCHGKDGKGRTPVGRKVGAKDLTQSKTTDAEIEKQIKEGKLASNGTPAMPAFKAKLDSDDIKLLIDFVKKFRK